MNKLLNCPFCGLSHLIICETQFQGKTVYCVTCRTKECHGGIFSLAMGEFPTKETAIKAWNTRAANVMEKE
jgi:Lar family restriction alleviation protein